MNKIKHFDTFLIILLAGLVGIFFFSQNSATPAIPDFVKATAPEPEFTTTSQLSSDGTHELTMKTKDNKDKTTTYLFTVVLKSDNTSQTIFNQTVSAETTFSIPFNTFSPNNKYLFIKQTENGKDHYLVFNSSGKDFADNQTSIDITPLFEKQKPNLTLKNVTGWASETLIIVQTSGPSFWFEMPNHFIQLSTKF